ncbi:MAG TPA: ABC transporter permease [Vicinamibacterales bacterium]|nr:ABC transporter permease [Vicinamibacterales bacterium]
MPDWKPHIRPLLTTLHLSPTREDEIIEELSQHLEDRWRELIAQGASEDEATRLALAQLREDVLARNLAPLRQSRQSPAVTPGVSTGHWASDLWRDLRYAVHTFRKQPGFAAAAILTLGLGIGATTAMFSVIDGVLLKPLPFPQPDRLVAMWHVAPELGFDEFQQSPATYFTYRDDNRVFEDVGLWVPFPDVSITGRGEPERVQALYVTDGTLPILKVQPLLGRLFTKTDDAPGSPDRTMLTYGYWQRRFGGAGDIVGQTVTIDSKPYEVIGVLPSSFRFLDRKPAVLLPLRLNRADTSLGSFSYFAIARLKAGVTIAQANDDVARMIPLVYTQFPARAGEQEIRLRPNVRPLAADVIGDVGHVLWILLGTVGIVLLTACANVANLFLVRTEARRRELAVRSALGASRGRLARGLITECVTLGLAGGVVGLVLARAGIGLLVWLAPSGLPRVEEIGLHLIVLLFTLATAIGTGLLFGLVAVLKFGVPSLTALNEGGRAGSEGPERHRTRNMLVVAQTALALVLLVVAGLMVRTFVALRHVEPGFTHPEHVQTFRVSIPETLVSGMEQTVRTHEQIAERLRQISGVQSVGLASSITMDGTYFNGSIFVEGVSETSARNRRFRRHRFIAPGYFETIGDPVLAGRLITWTDIYQDALVVVVSESLAREYWKDPADAIGKRIRVSANQPWREVIGVVGNERDDGLNKAAPTIAYWPMAATRFLDQPFVSRTMSYAVRCDRIGSPGFLHELQEAVWSVNPNLPLANVRTLDEIRGASMAQTSFALTMLVIGATLALLLGLVGLYGVTAYVAAQRKREIAIRMALGAQIGEVRTMLLRHGLGLTMTGIALGVGVALAICQVMRALLFGVSPMDPLTYVAVSAALAAVMLVAMYVPARRASRVDPVVALRADT